MAKFKVNDRCRICNSKGLKKFLDLGEMPLANSFIKKESLDKLELKFPLSVSFCPDCSLVQTTEVVDPSIMFEDYSYLTSASKPLEDHFCELGDYIVDRYIKSAEDLVVEIGSNDGVLIGHIKDRCKVLGVDPAKNVAELARERGVDVLCDFFGKRVASKIASERSLAKVIVANNVMAHIDDIKDVFLGVKELLSDDGVFIFEVHWVGNLIGEGGFDQIYHEHLCYYSLHSLMRLAEIVGLKVLSAGHVSIHGRSLRVTMGKKGQVEDTVGGMLFQEKTLSLHKFETYKDFSLKVEKNKKVLLKMIADLKARGKKIAGYGAPAKGNTLLNYFSFDTSVLDYITDTTPLKQGMFTPGTHIPIFSPDKIKKDPPDYILLLTWNYADAILEKERAIRDKGVKFIIPVPEVRIV